MTAGLARQRYPATTALIDRYEAAYSAVREPAPLPPREDPTWTVVKLAGNLLFALAALPVAAVLLFFTVWLMVKIANGG